MKLNDAKAEVQMKEEQIVATSNTFKSMEKLREIQKKKLETAENRVKTLEKELKEARENTNKQKLEDKRNV